MTRANWWIRLYDTANNLIDQVYYNILYFPFVDYDYTFELIDEFKLDDNSLGGSWEESCFRYGTPQKSNDDDCPCSFVKCQERGDVLAECDVATDSCDCSDGFVESGGVCVPVYPPQCCYAWWVAEADGLVRIQWCSASTSQLEASKVSQAPEGRRLRIIL